MKKLSEEQSRLLGLQEDTVVLAGAGAGKTTALASAVAEAVQGAEGGQVVGLCTFTRAAAFDVRSRVEALLEEPERASALWAGTIDALLYRFLRQEGPRQGWGLPEPPASRRQLAEQERDAWERALSQLPRQGWQALEDCGIDPTSSMKRFLQLREDLRNSDLLLRSAVSPQPSPEDVLEAMEELLANPELENDKQREALLADIEALHSGRPEALGAGKWGITRASLQEPLQEALRARNEYLQQYWNYKCEPVREVVVQLAETFFENLQEALLPDFFDLQNQAQELVSARGPIFSVLFIDEAQDSNALQNNLLRQMTDGPMIFIGDQNQSIYSFRGADPDLLAGSGGDLKLLDNYRSRPAVLRAIEALCSPLPSLGPRLLPMRAMRKDQEECSRKDSSGKGAEGPGAEEEKSADAEVLMLLQESYLPNAEVEAAAAVPYILERARQEGFALSDIGCLVRSNQEVEAYANAFRAHGAPALALRRGGLLAQDECRTLMALLRSRLFPEDEEALLQVMASPLLSFSDGRLQEIFSARGEGSLLDVLVAEEPEFINLLMQKHSGLLADWLRSLAEEMQFDLLLHLQDGTGSKWQNCLLFFDLLRRAEVEVGPDPEEIIRIVEGEGESDEQATALVEADAVKVMTVHQAKGGEFPFLVAARLSRRGPGGGRSFYLARDGHLGVSLGKGREDVWAKARKAELARRDAEEEERILYVALTRAQDKLMLVLSGSEKKDGSRGWGSLTASLPPALLGSGGGSVQVGPARFYVSEIEKRDLPTPSKVQAGAGSKDLPVYRGGLPVASESSLSYTKLAAWRRCSLRRLLEAELRLPGPDSEEGDAEKEGRGQRAFGIDFHSLLARAPWPQLPKASDPRQQELLQSLAEMDIYADICAGRDFKTEEPFLMMIAGLEISGSIDLLYRSGQARSGEKLVIVDWKTGQDKSDDYLLQRQIYTLAVLEDEPVLAQTVLLGSSEVVERLYLPEQREELLLEVEREVGKILQAPPVPASSSRKDFCAGCPGNVVICPVSSQ